MLSRLVAGLALALGLAYAAQPTSAPDIVILDARVYTGNPARPWAEVLRGPLMRPAGC